MHPYLARVQRKAIRAFRRAHCVVMMASAPAAARAEWRGRPLPALLALAFTKHVGAPTWSLRCARRAFVLGKSLGEQRHFASGRHRVFGCGRHIGEVEGCGAGVRATRTSRGVL